jgi:hypothetical protein
MFGRVLVDRLIAAADVAAGQAGPQMDPGTAHFQALLTPVGIALMGVYLGKVFAAAAHGHLDWLVVPVRLA